MPPPPDLQALVLVQLRTTLEACAATLGALEQALHTQTPRSAGPVQPRLLTVTQLCREHPALRRNTVYDWLKARRENGLAEAVMTVGASKRLLIEETAFFAWLGRYRDQARVRVVKRKGPQAPLRFVKDMPAKQVS